MLAGPWSPPPSVDKAASLAQFSGQPMQSPLGDQGVYPQCHKSGDRQLQQDDPSGAQSEVYALFARFRGHKAPQEGTLGMRLPKRGCEGGKRGEATYNWCQLSLLMWFIAIIVQSFNEGYSEDIFPSWLTKLFILWSLESGHCSDVILFLKSKLKNVHTLRGHWVYFAYSPVIKVKGDQLS